GLPLVERQRFMRRLRPYWEVLRHRAAPEALAAVEAWRSEGTFEIVPGTISRVEERGEGLEVSIDHRRGEPPLRRRFDRVVLCTGPETDVRRWTGALYRHLLRERHLLADPLGLGVQTDPQGRAL